MTTPLTLTVPTSRGDVPLTADERGDGPAILLLHGGAGPVSVTGFADLLAERTGSRVMVPVHPGFGGTERPEHLDSVAGLAELYAGLLDALDLTDVTVIGNSIGGWIAAELALRRSPRVGRLAIVNGVGIEVEGHPVAQASSPAELAQLAWHDPSKATVPDPAALPPAARDILLGNQAALAVYGGGMTDPTLRERLAAVDVPALVVWGESDRIADADYGRAYAAAIPGARFELLERTGHVPQLETPEVLLAALEGFLPQAVAR
ncbi:alpha/beta fold hydrolase [Pseudolysinimonas sp.]|uniref:alpha/beta fold hydrolase n=1 Tax=Pseudolysinimonas sp. TaxID=2680009 RepID=UPI003F7F8A00